MADISEKGLNKGNSARKYMADPVKFSDRTDFSAMYRRYTPDMLAPLMRITAALGTIGGARILPAVEDQLRSTARVGTVHYSNLIEGNELPVVEAERATRGELSRDSKAKIELVNYVEALDLIDRRLDDGTLEATTEFLKELHGTVTRGIGREEDPHFKPHHEGEWRDGTAVVFNHLTGRVEHEGPPKDSVPARMESLCEWVEHRTGDEQPYVIAGVAHWGITDIHPFADGNGRAARLFQAALLMKAQVLPGRIFSFERYYADDRDAYYSALRSVRRLSLNQETWLAYFLEGLANEYERVAATVADLSALTAPVGAGPLRLSTTQQAAITDLRLHGQREFSRRDYEAAAGIKRAAALNDLRDLIRHGIVIPRGSGPNTRYAFSGEVVRGRSARPGRTDLWSDARIERELRAFTEGRTSWPSTRQFQEAGLHTLYVAASRHGGIARWRKRVGL